MDTLTIIACVVLVIVAAIVIGFGVHLQMTPPGKQFVSREYLWVSGP